MDAPTAVRAGAWQPIGSMALLKLARVVAGSLLFLLALAALLICVRRTTGALNGTLPGSVLVVCGGILVASSLVFRGLWAGTPKSTSRLADIAHWAAPSGVILLSACGLSSRENSTPGLVALWGALALIEVWSWRQFLQRSSLPRQKAIAAPHRTDKSVAASSVTSSTDAFDSGPASDLDEQVSQRFVRRRAENGNETMDGWVRVEFAVGQRHANAHIAICPPFGQLPQCFAEQMDGPSATITVAQVLPNGIRCEIKLDEPAEAPDRVTVEFSIQEGQAEG